MSALISREVVPPAIPCSARMMMRSESTESTTPSRRAMTTAPESCAVTFQERNERSGHRHQLLGADVDEIKLFARSEFELSGLSGVGAVLNDSSLLVDL